MVMVCAAILSCSSLFSYIDPPSICLVSVGVICGTLASFPVQTIQNAFQDAFSHDIESEERALQGYQVFSKMSEYSVASGLTGTIIGLVAMLSNMDDPTAIGPAMAVALLTMLYGILMGEFFFPSLANECLSIKGIILERQSRRGLSTVYFTAMSLFLLLTTFFIMLLSMAGI